MPKSLTFETPSVTHGVRMGSILTGLVLVWCWGSLWEGREWVLWLRNRIGTPLVKRLVVMYFEVLGVVWPSFVAPPCEPAHKHHQRAYMLAIQPH